MIDCLFIDASDDKDKTGNAGLGSGRMQFRGGFGRGGYRNA